MKMLTSVHGHEVKAHHRIDIAENHLHVIELTAVCGKSVEVSRVTIGAVDGKRPVPPTKEHLQMILNDHRQRVADAASWKERVRENIQDIE